MKDMGQEDVVVTGYRGLDSEHHMQMELLDAFSRTLAEDPDPDTLDEILDRLIDYTKVHFSSEQLLMRLYQYPQYQDHVLDHERTIEQLQTLRAAYLAGDRELSRDTADCLADRLNGHMRNADRALGHFLVRLGVGPG